MRTNTAVLRGSLWLSSGDGGEHWTLDEVDPDAFWYDAAPLQNKDLTISGEHQLLEIEGMGKLLTMEVQFRRKKGEYFSIYTISEPASRLIQTSWNAVAMLRLLVATAAFSCVLQAP